MVVLARCHDNSRLGCGKNHHDCNALTAAEMVQAKSEVVLVPDSAKRNGGSGTHNGDGGWGCGDGRASGNNVERDGDMGDGGNMSVATTAGAMKTMI